MRAAILPGVVVIFLVGCGGKSDSEKTREAILKRNAEQQAARAASEAIHQAELAALVYRPANTNPEAFTHGGGRRTDDPEPQKLPSSARSDGKLVVKVSGLWGEGHSTYVFQRLKEIAQPTQLGTLHTGIDGEVEYACTGISDIDALGAVIDFGMITSVDVERNQINVFAESTRLPRPQQSIRAYTRSPRFRSPSGMDTFTREYSIEELLEGLTHWESSSRQAACMRLAGQKSMSMEEYHQVREAIMIRLDDVDTFVRSAAKRALEQLDSLKNDQGAIGGQASRERNEDKVQIRDSD